MTSITLNRICRYPVKGLGPIDMTEAHVEPDQGLTDDRRFALALKATAFDPDNPAHIHKTGFAMLMKNAKLAKLQTEYDATNQMLTVSRNGKPLAKGQLTDHIGRARLEDFFNAFLSDDIAGNIRIVEGRDGHMFSDHKNRVLSIISLDSIRDLERVTMQSVDPIRFRGNLIVDGIPAWQELTWEGRHLKLGSARLEVTARIDRCGATNVDPSTGERDMNIPKTLMGAWGHIDCGIYVKVVEPGEFKLGQPLELIEG